VDRKTLIFAGAFAAIAIAGGSVWWRQTEQLVEERFSEVDRRIESMLPKDRGLAPTPTFPDDMLWIRIHLTRKMAGETQQVRTIVQFDGEEQAWVLPPPGRPDDAVANEKRQAVLQSLRRRVRRALKAHGGRPESAKGEIIGGLDVPNADVIVALNVLLELSMTDVVFEGPSSGLTADERARALR